MTSQELCELANKYDDRICPFIEKALSNSIDLLNLSESTAIGYTLKAMAAGLWAYFNATSFEDGLFKVVNEGGDADTNASVAGSVLGAKFGFEAIPKNLVDGLLEKTKLEEKFNAYIDVVKQRYKYQTNA